MTWALPYVLARAGNPIVSRDRLIGRKVESAASQKASQGNPVRSSQLHDDRNSDQAKGMRIKALNGGSR